MSKPFKGSKGMIGLAEDWWNGLSVDDQQKWKAHYEGIRAVNDKRITPYPDMSDTTSTRLSKLTGHQIQAIWRFAEIKDRYKK